MQDIHRALDQISQIHDQLAVTREFGGMRSLPALLSGVFGVVSAALQPLLLDEATPSAFLVYWVLVALLCLFVGGSAFCYGYLRAPSEIERAQLRAVTAQFAPALLAGALVALVAYELESLPVSAIPGLWALIFGLGVFATRTLLPHAIGWVALYYLVAGALLLVFVRAPFPSGWTVGGVFGLGQLGGGLVLLRNLQRSSA